MRILFSLIIIIVMPYFLEKEETKPTEKKPVEMVSYYNQNFNYRLKYPSSFKEVNTNETMNDGIILTNQNDIHIIISGSRGVSDKTIDDVYEDTILKSIEETPNVEADYLFADQDHCKAYYKCEKNYYYEQVHHQGTKMVYMKIISPIEHMNQLKKIQSKIDLELSAIAI